MAWTECTSGSAIAMAGLNANSSLTAYGGTYATILDRWSDDAEGEIDLFTGKSFLSNYSSLPTSIQQAVSSVAAAKIAMRIIAYDTTGYLSREADTLLNVNNDIIYRGQAQLKEFTKIILKSPL